MFGNDWEPATARIVAKKFKQKAKFDRDDPVVNGKAKRKAADGFDEALKQPAADNAARRLASRTTSERRELVRLLPADTHLLAPVAAREAQSARNRRPDELKHASVNVVIINVPVGFASSIPRRTARRCRRTPPERARQS